MIRFSFRVCLSYDGPAKTRGWTFGISRKSEIRYFSAVAAQGRSLKIPDIVFFEIHPKSGGATFCRAVFCRAGNKNFFKKKAEMDLTNGEKALY